MDVRTIPNTNMATIMEAIKRGRKKDCPFCDGFVVILCKKINEVRSIQLRFIRVEDEKEIQKISSTPSPYDNPNRKAESSAQRFHKSKPYSK